MFRHFCQFFKDQLQLLLDQQREGEREEEREIDIWQAAKDKRYFNGFDQKKSPIWIRLSSSSMFVWS